MTNDDVREIAKLGASSFLSPGSVRLQPQSPKIDDSSAIDRSTFLGTADEGQTLQNGLHSEGFQTPATRHAALPLALKPPHPKSCKQCFELADVCFNPLIRYVAQLCATEVASQKLKDCAMPESSRYSWHSQGKSGEVNKINDLSNHWE
jgi:hypothetical protein